ncbi:MAG: YdcF family protein [Anaerolineaceae bacterium]|nr:YdcF family protein [Anaerolineaceae bacterium]
MKSTGGSKTIRTILFCLVLIILLTLTAVLFRRTILIGVGKFLIVEDDLHPADIIHVIAGLDHRTNYGIQLYHAGYADQLFLTGGWCLEHQDIHAQVAAKQAVEQGVAAEDIIIDDTEIISTYEEAGRLKIYIEQSPTPIESVIVVSDAFHMRRARWAYRRVLGKDIEILMAPVPLDESPYLSEWWTEFNSRQMVIEEYTKFIYYIARYQIARGKLQQWLASFDTE